MGHPNVCGWLKVEHGNRWNDNAKARDVTGFQPSSVVTHRTWAFGPGWYGARRWRFSCERNLLWAMTDSTINEIPAI